MFPYELLVKSLPFALRAPGCKTDFVTGGPVGSKCRGLDSMNSLVSYSQICGSPQITIVVYREFNVHMVLHLVFPTVTLVRD